MQARPWFTCTRRAILEVKRLLMANSSPAEIAVLAPDPRIYRSLVRAVAAEYGVPIQYYLPLMDNPAVATLAALLNLNPDFPWWETLDILRSRYIFPEVLFGFPGEICRL